MKSLARQACRLCVAGLLAGTVLLLSPSANATGPGGIAPMPLRMWWAEELTPTVMEDSEGVLLVPVSAYRATGLDNASKSGTLPKDVNAPAPPNTAADQAADRPADPPRDIPDQVVEEAEWPLQWPDVWTTVFDLATLEVWAQTGFVPGFMEGISTDEPVPVEQAVFDLEMITASPSGTLEYYQMRVRRSDGAITLVSRGIVGGESEPAVAERGRAGFWWPWCCGTQYFFCNAIRGLPFIGPLLCPECYNSCLVRCLRGGSNPCHSCDPCGLSQFFCHIVPGGHCD